MSRRFPWLPAISGLLVLVQGVLLTISQSPTVIFSAAVTVICFIGTLVFWSMT